MNLKTRRIIMFIFIFAFLIIGPILLFYASGYRYDLKRNKIIKTGTLMVEAKDLKEANLYLNDQLYELPFNEKIFVYNLLPGEYKVKLEKNNYHDWEKKVTINSSITTFAKDVVLFKNELPVPIIEGQILNFQFSPDLQRLFYLLKGDQQNELFIYDIETKVQNLITKLNRTDILPDLSWAASSKKILINDNQTWSVIDVQTNKQITLNNLIKFQPTSIKWDINSDNLLYLDNSTGIYQLDLLAQKVILLFTKPIDQPFTYYFLEKNDIFYIAQGKSHNFLTKYNFNFKTTKQIYELPLSNNYQFITSNNNYIGLIDLALQKLYLIKKVNTDLEININRESDIKEFNAKAATWDKKENELAIYNDFEITVYNTETNQENFINRYGQIINNVAWYPNLKYLIILFPDKISMIDLNSDYLNKNTFDLVKFDKLDNFYLDKKGQNLYLSGQIGQLPGLYQLTIK